MNMEKKLAALYNDLANQIADMIPVEWDDVYYLGEVAKGRRSWSSVFYFTDVKTGRKIDSGSIFTVYDVPKDIFVDLLIELNNILLKIYNSFLEEGQKPWEQLNLFFNRNGKFEIEFKYDVMKENDGGQFVREIIWAYDTFGYIPAEGTYAKSCLDRYLKK